jgi:hypothetical protein
MKIYITPTIYEKSSNLKKELIIKTDFNPEQKIDDVRTNDQIIEDIAENIKQEIVFILKNNKTKELTLNEINQLTKIIK